MARLAIICNIAFVLTLMKMLLNWFKIPDFLANFIAVLGLEMSPVVNISFAIWWLALKLRKKSKQRNFPSRKYAQVTVHGEDGFVRLHSQRGTHGNRFLAVGGKPFGNSALAQRHQHFFFNHARL